MSNPLRTQYTIQREAKKKYKILKTKMMCSNDPIKSRGIQEWAQYAHNSQYEDKQTYTIHSTKTNKHTQYTVRRQTNIHNIQYEDKQTYTTHSTKTNTHTKHNTEH
jgi:hypothetical protein